MDTNYQRTLFIFRRDLRLHDNTGLIQALERSKEVIPCFIFTPLQLENNPYRSDACVQFMLDSLQDLEEQLKKQGGKLYLFYGQQHEIVEQLIKIMNVDSVVANRDYTPFSISRDNVLKNTCDTHKIPLTLCDDVLLNPPETTLKSNKQPYSIFSPYYRNACSIKVHLPQANRKKNYFHAPISFAKDSTIYSKILPKPLKEIPFKGGRQEALKILNKIAHFKRYADERDFPALDATTHLSAHLKFTTVSPREVYHSLLDHFNKNHALIRSLYWRDFFSSIACFFPHVFHGAFHKKFDALSWSHNKTHFLKWCEGQTGFPIVDAGMRELNTTGFMHNRVRMVVASFLTKDLHLPWQWGELYFAQKLVDYDPAVNNGNWQWAASTGCDAQPYFRIFNPWNQQKKFDPDCIYIKKWVKELQNLPPKTIHEWHLDKLHPLCPLYATPMVEHDIETKKTLQIYKSIS